MTQKKTKQVIVKYLLSIYISKNILVGLTRTYTNPSRFLIPFSCEPSYFHFYGDNFAMSKSRSAGCEEPAPPCPSPTKNALDDSHSTTLHLIYCQYFQIRTWLNKPFGLVLSSGKIESKFRWTTNESAYEYLVSSF